MRHSQANYIIRETEYLMRWTEPTLVKYYTTDTIARFIFEISRFGCPRSLTSDQQTHFIKNTVSSLLQNFLIQHHKRSPYHPQENGTVEKFNKILEKVLTKVCLGNQYDWDEREPSMIWGITLQ